MLVSLIKNQVVQTLVLAVIGIIAIACCRQPKQRGLSEGSFWAQKSAWSGEASMVIGGDSRIYRGVSPAVMAQTLDNHTIKNFGFGGLGFSPEYLAALSRVLNPSAEEKIIVLGITPHSLTLEATEKNGFVNIDDIAVENGLDFIASNQYLKPMKFGSLARLLLGRKQNTFLHEKFFETGYVAVNKRPHDLSGLSRYKTIFENNQVADQIEMEVIQFIGHQTEQGIQVFVTRPPVAPEMLELENKKSGFDEEKFFTRIESAGGTIIRTNQEFETYDGHHLQKEASEAYSEFLAQSIKKLTKPKQD